MDSRPPVIAIVGPTAVGKTVAAIALAQRVDGEIVSADSRLLYRGMNIGTAKPSVEERSKVPHHLIDVADPDEVWSLTRFQQAAANAIAGIHACGKLPILIGGTGQYLRAIVEGWAPPKLAPQPKLRAALAAWTVEVGALGLHQRLAVLDRVAAQKIDHQNVRRTQRALEVIFATGQRFSQQRTKAESPYRLLQLGLTRPRPELYARIDQRIEDMLTAGWLDEVKALASHGYDPALPSMTAIGYAQLGQHLRGELSLADAVAEIKRKTRIFVRRQGAWFRPSDPAIIWFEAGDAELDDKLAAAIHSFLAITPAR